MQATNAWLPQLQPNSVRRLQVAELVGVQGKASEQVSGAAGSTKDYTSSAVDDVGSKVTRRCCC